MACAKVFGNYELIEQLLLSLPLRQILLARRVNKACDDVVSRSQAIQRALLLRPSAKVVTPEVDWDEKYGYAWKEQGDAKAKTLLINPFLDT